MEFDPHERSRCLASEARVTGISIEESLWLRSHVADCAECARFEQEVEGVVRGIKSFAFDVAAGSGDRLEAAIARRATRPLPMRRWGLAAAALLIAVAIPVFEARYDAQRDRADARLIEAVENRVSRIVPVAMEPLLQRQTGDSQ